VGIYQGWQSASAQVQAGGHYVTDVGHCQGRPGHGSVDLSSHRRWYRWKICVPQIAALARTDGGLSEWLGQQGVSRWIGGQEASRRSRRYVFSLPRTKPLHRVPAQGYEIGIRASADAYKGPASGRPEDRSCSEDLGRPSEDVALQSGWLQRELAVVAVGIAVGWRIFLWAPGLFMGFVGEIPSCTWFSAPP